MTAAGWAARSGCLQLRRLSSQVTELSANLAALRQAMQTRDATRTLANTSPEDQRYAQANARAH